MARTRDSRGRRWLASAAAVATAALIAGVFAPGHSRWLAAEGMEVFYDTFDSGQRVPFGPAPVSGLAVDQIEHKLAAVDSGWSWTVSRTDPQTPFQLRFAYEDPTRPSVEKFRERTRDFVSEPLDLLSVAKQVRALTQHRYDTNTTDPVELLEHGRAGDGLVCHQFAYLFGTVLSSRGYVTRVVSLSATGEDFDHALCEVYDPDRGKWIAFDLDFCMTYQRDGQILNAVEIQDAWKKVRSEVGIGFGLGDKPRSVSVDRVRELAGIELVPFAEIEPNLRTARLDNSPSGMNLELFEFTFLAIRDDYLTGDYPVGHPLRVRQVCFRADGSGDELCDVCPEAIFASVTQAYAPVGSTEIAVKAVTSEREIELELGTKTPHFLLFEYSIDSSPWSGTAASSLTWQLHGGRENQIRVRSVNNAGVRGAVTSLRIKGYHSGS